MINKLEKRRRCARYTLGSLLRVEHSKVLIMVVIGVVGCIGGGGGGVVT